MTALQNLKALMAKATPGRLMNNPHYECVHTHSELVELRPVLHYSHNNPNSENDAELYVAMRNALPDLLALADAAESLSDTLQGCEQTLNTLVNDDQALDRMRAALARLTTPTEGTK